MKVFLVSLLVATLAVSCFANVVPSNVEEALEVSNFTSVQNATTLNLNEGLAELLNAYKNVMPCGNATYNVPQMAPFRQPSVDINFIGEYLALKGNIKNLVIAGLDDYLIIELAHNASSNRTEMDMLYKDIQILGKFNLKIEADLAGFKYVQPLEGFINLQLLNLRITNGLTIGQNEAGGIQVSDMEYSLQVGDIVVNNLNTQWGVAVNNFANQYIRDFTMLFLQTNREMFDKMYSEAATQMLNNALYNVPYSYLGSSLVEAVNFLKSMDCKR